MNEKAYKVVFSPKDTLNERLKKAAHVCPSPAQLKWMEREYICFLHFSPNTFTNRQWGDGTETVEDFHPDKLDPAQWAAVCKAAGMKLIIPTLKHHDGFCQWHTETTDFSVVNGPVKNDIAKELSEACAKEGIDFGVYVSPWDMNLRGRGVWPNPEYQQVFLDQLKEVFSNYGKVDELWLDGACGDRPIWSLIESYKPEEWYDLMEKLQPDCIVRKYDPFFFADEETWQKLQQGEGELSWRGKEVRWVGNEDGLARTDEWSVQPVFTRGFAREATFNDLGEEKYYESAVGAVWYPNEVNTHVMNQWFWNEGTSKVRPMEEMIDIFYHSVGNNGVFLLNISPDVHGRITEDQIERLMELKRFVDDTFGTDLAEGASINAESECRCAAAANMLVNDREKFWTPDVEDWSIDSSTCSFEIILPEARAFDNLLISEAIENGQRVAHWRASAWLNGEWKTIAEKKTIGYKVICRFDEVTTDRVKIEILRSWDTPMISRVSLHKSHMPESMNSEGEAVITAAPMTEVVDGLKSGINYTIYDRGIQSAAEIDKRGLNILDTGVCNEVSLNCCDRTQDFSIVFDGYMKVSAACEKIFELGSCDGCIFELNGTRVIDIDEPHDYLEKRASVKLCEGMYHFTVKYTSFRNKGKLSLRVSDKDGEFVQATDKMLLCR